MSHHYSQYILVLLSVLLDFGEMLNAGVTPGIFRHITCRNALYPRSSIQRFPVPDEFVFWSVPYPAYEPVNYTASHINGQVWADPELSKEGFSPRWHQIDGAISRVSYTGKYEVAADGYPLNPIGRTGVRGRGLLGRWGPNHAADPVVTRWKRDANGAVVQHENSKKSILQMIAVQRHDNKMWAIPGGMVDPGEKVSKTLQREFMEEALNSFGDEKMISEFFERGIEIYRGYVDDFRNTDNAWMETEAYNFHDETGSQVGALKLMAGDDAANVKWTDVDSKLQLHANHIEIVKQVAERLNSHW